MRSYKTLGSFLMMTLMVSLVRTPYALGQKANTVDLLQYVNTLQGSHNTPEFSHGRCVPLVGLPHSMTYWSPEGYPYNRDTIYGFGSKGSFSFMPVAGTLDVREKNSGAAFDFRNVIAKPNYYKVTFSDGITTEITATERCGYFKVSYPNIQKGYLVINGNADEIEIDTEKRIVTNNGRNFFVIQFDQPFLSSGKMEAQPGTRSKNGFYIEFKKGSRVQFKVATSAISLAQAKSTFGREIEPYSFNQIKDAAGKVWNELLNKIVVEGGTPEQKKTFYSCLYRTSLRPAKIHEVDNEGKSHFYQNGKVYDGYNHSHPTFWDTYRSLYPLENILNTAGQKEYVKSLQASVPLTGWLPNGMIGNHAISIFADAWSKGIRTFNPDSALKHYYHEVTHSKLDESNGYFIEHQRGVGRFGYADYFAIGYIPFARNSKKVTESTSRTLEYAYDDFCAYKLAKMTGNKFYEEVFSKHMFNYKNVFDPADHFMKGRDAEGNWQNNFNPYEWGGPFVEGNGWQWKFSVQHDVQGFIDLIGGDKKFISELDELFAVPSDSALVGGYGEKIHEISEVEAGRQGQYAGGNEPDFHVIYLYNYAGQPWNCQKLLRESLVKLFNSGPDGFPGDEDGGAMASWYVFSALGFYPVTPGVDQYAIGSPLFNKATITLENGKKFTVVADNNSSNNVYVQSATLNGKPYNHNWIMHEDIINGGTLKFQMGSNPNLKRGSAIEDRPFSVSKSENKN